MTGRADGSRRVVRISADELPERNREEVLREVYGRTIVKHDFEPLSDRPYSFTATLRALPGLGLSSVAGSNLCSRRTSQHIDSDDLVLNVTLAGTRSFRQRPRGRVRRRGGGSRNLRRRRHCQPLFSATALPACGPRRRDRMA